VNMRMRELFIFVLLVFEPAAAFSAITNQKARLFVGQDLHLAGREVISYQPSTGVELIVFTKGFSMSIGANQFFSDSAVVWLERQEFEVRNLKFGVQKAKVYLEGSIEVKKGEGAKTTDLEVYADADARYEDMVVRFCVSGEVFLTAERRELGDPRGLELYKNAVAAVSRSASKFVEQAEVPAPELPVEKRIEKAAEEVVAAEPVKLAEEAAVKRAEIVTKPKVEKPSFRYPVNIAPVGEVEPKVERTRQPDGTDVDTVIGRFYVWQKQDEEGGLLELEADNAVMFLADSGQRTADKEELKAERYMLNAIYMSGDVVMTEGQRTIVADEMYYDFEREKCLAINAVMRNFDALRGIPIYVRAVKLRQLAENKFGASDITLTSSEFYLPQISLNASSVIITDTTTVDAELERLSDSSYDAEMRDVRLKVDDRTIFYWPFMRSDLQRPDTPLKSIHVGRDSTWGTSVETRWHLARMLGLREPEGTDSTFALDYYGERGVGSGAEIKYAREDYFGRMLGYVIHDSGEDDLGRYYERRNLKPARELRGRFLWQHRHFLPYNWQLTSEISYVSDEHFIEGYYRSEFNISKERETLIHLKRIEDNWGLSILGKARINHFVNKLEELPSVEFHLTGESLFDDKLTLYSDSQVSRFRHRLASSSSAVSQEYFTFASERAELDMPMRWGGAKVVPFVAGTIGYDDGSGFRTDIDGRAAGREDKVWMGEAGARVSTQYWKVYPDVKSRVWDLNELRHIIKPHLTAVCYADSDSVIEQRDVLNVGVSQRLQTRRGGVGVSADKQRSIDWMRLDMDVTLVRDTAGASDSGPGPDRFIWNKPFIPLVDRFSKSVPPRDRRSSDIFGPRRNYFGADYMWRVSDTTALLSDLNFDMQSGVVQQFNIGFSHLRWPNLNYYIGSRYLRRFNNNLGEKGSNAFIFAATYILDPRYTVVYSAQLDFDYGETVRSDITFIRRYHRIYCGFTYSADYSLDKQAVVFSIWPQGVPELAIGPRRYMGMAGSAGY